MTTIAIAIAMAIATTIDFERRGIRDWKSIDFIIKSIEKASILSARTSGTGKKYRFLIKINKKINGFESRGVRERAARSGWD